MFLIVVFLLEKVGPRREEGVRRLLQCDREDGMAVPGAQTAQHVQHLASLTNQLADVAERFREFLEAPGLLGDVHVTLDQVAELSL